MPHILHMIGIGSPPSHATYKALTTRDGLAGWWAETTNLDGDVIRFRFGDDTSLT